RFKELADKKHEIFDEDLQALVSEARSADVVEFYQFVSLESHSATGEKPVSSVVINIDGQEQRSQSNGSGPVDATFKAIEAIVESNTTLQLYSVNAITQGTDSQGEVTVRLEKAGRIVNGSGADTDIIVASAKAYLHALNLLQPGRERTHPQNEGV
ncbi:MAG: alpha-isopropylmalate synthase regulatory domain-containing protein, partial [Oleibacter sp.]|nr:alpha-isopropylmalate synthase regulatory domain-containing protein [Thalassolituus sp.]